MTFPEKTTLAIVGAGPKALATAAKAKVLRECGLQVPEIVIVERGGIARNWRPESGLTSGMQPLGTSPEKDVGFPYESIFWGRHLNQQVDRAMLRYSWASFLVAQRGYAEWIDRGKPAPNHERWANYLHWIYEDVASDLRFVHAEVTAARLDGESWVLSLDAEGNAGELRCQGLMFTGPGDPASHGFPQHPRMLTTEQFWRGWRDYLRLERVRFAVVGTGETAASILVSLAQTGPGNEIDVISPVAMSYTRGESFVENHIYTDPFQGNWFDLSEADRRSFISRTDRGVFSVNTKKVLDLCNNVSIVPGMTKRAYVDNMGQAVLETEYNGRMETQVYDYVIWATGYNYLGYISRIIGASAREEILRRTALPAWNQNSIERNVDQNLAIEGLYPRLHLPMLAGLTQGPGFANLSCLGRLSDHVLGSYVDGVEASLA